MRQKVIFTRFPCDNFLNSQPISAAQPMSTGSKAGLADSALEIPLLAELLASSAEMREVVRVQLSILPEEFGLWLSLVERLVRDQEAVGSNPTSPMTKM